MAQAGIIYFDLWQLKRGIMPHIGMELIDAIDRGGEDAEGSFITAFSALRNTPRAATERAWKESIQRNAWERRPGEIE